jgi:hypothetical protein
MAIMTAAISAERLAPNGQLVARVVGTIAVYFGLYLTLRGFSYPSAVIN